VVTDSWEKRSACRDEDPELFFPVSYSGDIAELQIEEARAVCRGCPVAAECLRDALEAERGKGRRSRNGIRAGWTPGERYRGHVSKHRRHSLAA
jgi:hypothetical protein